MKDIILSLIDNIFFKYLFQWIVYMKDINTSEFAILFTLGILIVFFGFYPEPFLETMHMSVDNLISNYNSEINRHLAFK